MNVISWVVGLVKRKIVHIDEEKCDGCGQCLPNCAEGALKIVDGKVRLVSDEYCDGLGACLGNCPKDALSIIERDASEFDEEAVHQYLEGKEDIACGCPSAQSQSLEDEKRELDAEPQASCLSHWPVQLNLVPVKAPFFNEADLLLMADCVAVAHPNLHVDLLKRKVVLMGCPKFDDAESYVSKLAEILRQNQVRSLTVAHMEVPCCSGMDRIAQQAIRVSGKMISLPRLIVSVEGEVTRV
ncbi:4Fe-4S ferredoxin [Candidatus Bathyarchaeota archaeon]|nr:4Fe-4S ferredoxin [Candidatus Bathyarchaeota archaeon]